MPVGVVTDSIADLPGETARALRIGVVPLILRFGNNEFRDGVDLSPEGFYRMLQERQEFPFTATPSPAAFVEACERQETSEVLIVTVSSKLSSTLQVAATAREMLAGRVRVEVLDSGTATLNEGFIVLRAAEAARAGASLAQVREAAQRARARVDFLCTFDTLEYLRRGGRIGAAAALLGSLLKVNPLINLRDGLVQPAGRTRSRAAAVDRLFAFAAGYSRIEELAVEHTACPEEAEALVERLATLHPRERIYRSTMTPVIGAHTGPGLLLVGILGDREGRPSESAATR